MGKHQGVEVIEEKKRIFSDWKLVTDQTFFQATHDSLTGLPNRALFQNRLRIDLSESKRHHEILGILFIDLDHFKEVNDLLGHGGGDRVLAEVGLRLSQAIRSEEMIARVGGDEFVVLIRRLKSSQEAEIVARRLMHALELPLLLENQSLKITASIGISLFPFDGEEEETLLHHADTAMFRVKKNGGNDLEFFKKHDHAIFPIELSEPLSKQKILIVDDDLGYQLVLQNCLKKAGYTCISAVNVEEALKQVKFTSPDLVILDLGFRKASGIAFLMNLSNSLSKDQKIPPVLVVSGYDDPEIVEFVTTLGASLFIPKPIGSSQIISAIQSFIH